MEAEHLLAAVEDGTLVTPAGDLRLVNIWKIVVDLFAKFAKEELVLQQFELLWAKVEAHNFPKIPDVLESFVKKALHDTIVAAIRHYLPA